MRLSAAKASSLNASRSIRLSSGYRLNPCRMALDDDMALLHARDLYTRRNEGVSIWAVRSDTIAASAPDEKDPFFAPSADKVYRHPTFYDIPDDVPHI